MANSQGICSSFKLELFSGTHNLTSDTIKVALYKNTASISPSTSAYTSANETPTTGGYTAGGAVVAATVPPSLAGSTVIWTPSSNFTWTSATFSTAVNACLLYNSSKSNKAISVHTFGDTTITAGSFTLTMPTNTSTTALIRMA